MKYQLARLDELKHQLEAQHRMTDQQKKMLEEKDRQLKSGLGIWPEAPFLILSR